MDGATILATALKSQGVEYAFGVVGIPIIEVSVALQNIGIKFVAMRNEQSASYAASAIGYLTRRPAVCLVVSGPGFVHALAGLSNANENCWPVLVIGGASDSHLDGSGAFQEFPQVAAAERFCKFSARLTSLERIPYLVHKAIKFAMYGRPGAAYLDLPGELVGATADNEDAIRYSPMLPEPPVMQADPATVMHAAKILRNAARPLVIIGKGAAYDRAEEPIRRFIDHHRLPFLPTPMGKGVVPDDHPLCCAAARTAALRSADAVLLLGARLNWILHFGLSPRFAERVQFVQVDICPEEFHTNVTCTATLCGNVSLIVEQLHQCMMQQIDSSEQQQLQWQQQLVSASSRNQSAVQELVSAGQSEVMNYHSALTVAARHAAADWLIVSEGANTMDIGRSLLLNRLPRRRLDAGTFGTMGVGLGFALAAELCRENLRPQPARVLCVEGDSAIGFSLAEAETLVRYRAPVIILVINNNGIYSGLPPNVQAQLAEGKKFGQLALSLPPTALASEFRYDQVMEAAGGVGKFATNVQQLEEAFQYCITVQDRPCLINALIDTMASRKHQEFDWLTRSKL